MNARLTRTVAAATLAASAAVAAPASHARAGATIGDENVVVAFRDLDLAQPEGRATLHGRLRAAARAVCGAPEREEVRALFARRDCYAQSIEQAIRSAGLDRQQVAAVL